MPEPFSIRVPDAVLGDLKERLARTRWPDQLPGTGWEYTEPIPPISVNWPMYYEFSHEPLATGRIEAPVGMLMSTKDLFPAAPREWGERFFNVQRWVETKVGGHFLEWEEPELVAREVQAFFGSVTPKP